MKYFILLLLIGCSEDVKWSEPYHKCLQSESYTWTSMMLVGKVLIPQVHTGRRCKKYTEDFFISHGEDVYVLMLTK